MRDIPRLLGQERIGAVGAAVEYIEVAQPHTVIYFCHKLQLRVVIQLNPAIAEVFQSIVRYFPLRFGIDPCLYLPDFTLCRRGSLY